jgi:hypothetical protein
MLLLFAAVALASQPFFIVTNINPEFASFSSPNFSVWCPNLCSFPVGSQNIFGSGSPANGLVYAPALDMWVITSGGGANLCWSSDGIGFSSGGGTPPQCTAMPSPLSDVAYSARRNTFIFTALSGPTFFFNFTGPRPAPNTRLNPTAITTTNLIDVNVWGIAYAESQDRFVAVGEGSANGRQIAWSDTGGATWVAVASSPFDNGGIGNSIVYNCYHDRWVAVGQGVHSIAWSPDGKVCL